MPSIRKALEPPVNVSSMLVVSWLLRPLLVSSNCTARLYVPANWTGAVAKLLMVAPAGWFGFVVVLANTTLPSGLPPVVGFGNGVVRGAAGARLCVELLSNVPENSVDFGMTPGPAGDTSVAGVLLVLATLKYTAIGGTPRRKM